MKNTNIIEISTQGIRYVVGENADKITEHSAQGEGDKWYYDIERKDGKTERLFNVERVIFSNLTPSRDNKQ